MPDFDTPTTVKGITDEDEFEGVLVINEGLEDLVFESKVPVILAFNATLVPLGCMEESRSEARGDPLLVNTDVILGGKVEMLKVDRPLRETEGNPLLVTNDVVSRGRLEVTDVDRLAAEEV